MHSKIEETLRTSDWKLSTKLQVVVYHMVRKTLDKCDFTDEDDLSLVIEVLNKGPYDHTELLEKILLRARSTAVMPIISNLLHLKEQKPRWRLNALRVLGQLGDKRAASLVRYLDDDYFWFGVPSVVESHYQWGIDIIKKAFTEICKEDISPLISALSGGHIIRLRAIDILGDIGNEQAIGPLFNIFEAEGNSPYIVKASKNRTSYILVGPY